MDEKQELEQLQAAFPDWDIVRIFGGFRATPKDTPVTEAVYLDDLGDKLADLDDEQRWRWVVSLGITRR